MNSVNRVLINICSKNLKKSAEFYTLLFDFEINFKSEWFVQMVSSSNNIEIGIIEEGNDIVPKEISGIPNGLYLTFVV